MMKNFFILFAFILPVGLYAQQKTVVLTFDDACSSHYHFVAPVLLRYGFHATFYVCEFPGVYGDSAKSLNWRQVQDLSKMGFEIGNHTWHHVNIDGVSNEQFETELAYVENKCDSLGIPKMHSFCYPAYHTDSSKLAILHAHGYTTARAGSDRVYQPGKDDAMFIPGFTIHSEDANLFYKALEQANKSTVVVFTFHGVPDVPHPWVSTAPAVFETYMKYLYDHHYRVIAMRDLSIRQDPR